MERDLQDHTNINNGLGSETPSSPIENLVPPVYHDLMSESNVEIAVTKQKAEQARESTIAIGLQVLKNPDLVKDRGMRITALKAGVYLYRDLLEHYHVAEEDIENHIRRIEESTLSRKQTLDFLEQQHNLHSTIFTPEKKDKIA